ncbi:MAG: hypothetical protein J3K34DRAFT_517001 [Monoraphidium minutum]|nr:MAG: hypothetical protein J3K34DRAFT_517001 [Monoraphidium minutum]
MDRPPCRPLALHVTDPCPSLNFALTLEPDSDHTELPVPSTSLAFDERTLKQAAEALAATDVSYLQPRHPPAAFRATSGSVEAHLLAYNPSALSLEAAAAGHQHHVQSAAAGAAGTLQQRQQQQQHVMKEEDAMEVDAQEEEEQQQQRRQKGPALEKQGSGKRRRASAHGKQAARPAEGDPLPFVEMAGADEVLAFEPREQAAAPARQPLGKAEALRRLISGEGSQGSGQQAAAERKRRRRGSGVVHHATNEDFVGRGVDVHMAAADASEAITSFLEELEAAAAEYEAAGGGGDEEDGGGGGGAGSDEEGERAEEEEEGEEEEGGGARGSKRRKRARRGKGAAAAAAPPARRRLSRPLVPLRKLQRLGEALSQARGVGAVALVECGLLARLLAGLQGHVELGLDRAVADEEESGSPNYDAAAAALEAAACCLQVLAAPGLPNQLYREGLVTGLVTLTKFHLQYNLLVLYDDKYRRMYRPSSMGVDGDDAEGAGGKGKGASAKKRQKMERQQSLSKAPRGLAALQGRVEVLLSLLSRALGRCRAEPELLLPLGRVAMQTMPLEVGGEGLALLQLQAAGLVAALFRHYPGHRGALMSDFLSHVVGQLGGGGRAPPRPVMAGAGAGQEQVCIQVATAAVVLMIQSSVSLPALDAPPDAVRACCSAAGQWAAAFWEGVFDKLPAARAAKSDTAQDTRAVVDGLLRDMLAIQCLPDWPAANVMLRLFAKTLSEPKARISRGGLRHADTNVKALCVDFTGRLVRALCEEALRADVEAQWVEGLVELVEAEERERRKRGASDDDAPAPDEPDAGRRAATLQRVLLESMGAWGPPAAAAPADDDADGGGGGTAGGARRYLACQMLQDALLAAARAKVPAAGRRGGGGELSGDEVASLLVAHRSMLEARGGGLLAEICAADGTPLNLEPGQACRVARRLVVDGPLGAGRAAMLGWLVEAGDRQRQDANAAQARRGGANVRAKAVKCIAAAAEVDPRVLGMPEVQRGVATALQDDSVSVREAAVELLARHITADPGLAEDYFDVLAEASTDNGVSVRKRAVKALWECCARCPGFTRRTGAVVAILQCVADAEESMRTLVTRLCADMWFAPGSSGEAEGAPAGGAAGAGGAPQRAEELSRVALAVYEAGGRGIHLPLPNDHLLVSVVSCALAAAGDGGRGAAAAAGKAVARGAAEVAGALLDQVVQLQGGGGEGEGEEAGGGGSALFSRLLALHVLAAAEPGLVVPPRDAQRFVRALAPYATPPDAEALAQQSDDDKRRGAEELLCLLAVLQAAAAQLPALAAAVGPQLTKDLANITSKHMYTQVVASSAACLCSLARLDASVGPLVGAMARKMYDVVEAALAPPVQGDAAQARVQRQAVMQLPRVLFLLGQLCRHGADLLDAAGAAPPAPGALGAAAPPPPASGQCLELFLRVWRAPKLGPKAMDVALQAMGLLFISRPALILQEGSGAAAVYRQALRGAGGPAARARVLSNLVELLRCDEDSMLASQKAAEAANVASQQASTVAAPARAALARQNGEGDGGHLSSGLLQARALGGGDMWAEVLALAVEAPSRGGAAGPSPGAAPEAAAAALRRKALELIEVVLRGGHVAPWTAVAPLAALCTDPSPETRRAALRVLRVTFEKYPDYVSDHLAPAGVAEAWRLQRRLWEAAHPSMPPPGAPRAEAARGLGDVYAELVQPDNKLKARFLHKLLAPFSDLATAAAAGAHAAADAPHGRASAGGAAPPPQRRASAAAEQGGGAALPEPELLTFCAHVAAALPARRADEPLLLLHHIDGTSRRHAGGALERLRGALVRAGHGGRVIKAAKGALDEEDLRLDDDAPDQPDHADHADRADHANGGGLAAPPRGELLAAARAALGLAALLVLKQYLMAAFWLAEDRVAGFAPKGERRRAEEKAMVTRNPKVQFSLSVLNPLCLEDATGDLLAQLFVTFKARGARGLIDQDSACRAAAHGELDADEDGGEGADGGADSEGGEGGGGGRRATEGGGEGGTPGGGGAAKPGKGLVVFSTTGRRPPAGGASTRGKGRGSAGRGSGGRGSRGARGGRGSGASAGRGSGRGGRGKRRRSKYGRGSDDDDDSSGGDGEGGATDDEDYQPAKQLF